MFIVRERIHWKNFSSVALANEIGQVNTTKPDYVADLSDLPQVLFDSLQDEDVVILQGAGDVGSVAKKLMTN